MVDCKLLVPRNSMLMSFALKKKNPHLGKSQMHISIFSNPEKDAFQMPILRCIINQYLQLSCSKIHHCVKTEGRFPQVSPSQ